MGLLSVAPWVGVRLPLGGRSALLVKYRQQAISFTYEDPNGAEQKQNSSLSTVVVAYYTSRGRLDAYGAAFQIIGSDAYSGTGLDAGFSYRLRPRLSAEVGAYLLNERSVLWYPDEPLRRISTFSGHGGLSWRFLKKWQVDGDVIAGSTSDHVSTLSWSAGLTFLPFDPLYVHLAWMRYSETNGERRSGNYVMAGINFYF